MQVPFSLTPGQYDKYARRSFRRCASPASSQLLEPCGLSCESGGFRPPGHGQGASRSRGAGVERAGAAASGAAALWRLYLVIPGLGRAGLGWRIRFEHAVEAWSWRLPSARSEEHTSDLQSLMRISYAVFCLKKKHNNTRE